MNATLRAVLSIAFIFLPSGLKVWCMRHILGFDISPKARIGYSLILCTALEMEDGAYIGHFNVFKGDLRVHIKRNSSIGQFNWITGGSSHPGYFEDCAREREFILGEESHVTSRHLIDCTTRVSIGNFTTLAGYQDTILTHGIDYSTNRQTCRPVEIGDYCLLGTNVCLLMGCKVPNRSVVGAGAVITKPLEGEMGVWVGVPARRIKDLTEQALYFSRIDGRVY